jgi:hypothetical protein
MKTYQEAIWKLALKHAFYDMGGGYPRAVEGLGTVAWIFEVSRNQVQKDVDNALKEAWKVAGKSWEEAWAAMPVIKTYAE